MRNCRKNLIMVVALTILGIAPCCYAQSLNAETVDNAEFKLNSVDTALEADAVPSKTKAYIDEYKLSLGSQMLSYQASSRVSLSDSKHIDTGYKGLNAIKVDEAVVSERPAFELGSTITLNNSYEANSIGFNDSNITGVVFATKVGKLDLQGGYNQSNLPLTAGNESETTESTVLASARASVAVPESASEDSVLKSVEASLASDYYLEAVYSFKPDLKGKVAFKKSMIDTFDTKENVKVEGIVEATSDVSIKAGYSQENRIEVETKIPKEKKFYTEFILKF